VSADPLLRLRVSPESADAFVVDVVSRDILVWEKGGRDRSYAALMVKQDMAPLYEIAHQASVRAGRFAGSLAAFESTCDIAVAPPDEETDAASVPTRPARSTARRSRSR
jgi:hypothetical protein